MALACGNLTKLTAHTKCTALMPGWPSHMRRKPVVGVACKHLQAPEQGTGHVATRATWYSACRHFHQHAHQRGGACTQCHAVHATLPPYSPHTPSPWAPHTPMLITPSTLHAVTCHRMHNVAHICGDIHGEWGAPGRGARACKAPCPSKTSTHLPWHAKVGIHKTGLYMHAHEALAPSNTAMVPPQ